MTELEFETGNLVKYTNEEGIEKKSCVFSAAIETHTINGTSVIYTLDDGTKHLQEDLKDARFGG